MSLAPEINAFVLVNGRFLNHVPVSDRGLQYGDGLFETIRVVDGACQYWEEHIDRLGAGCERLGIAFPGMAVIRNDAGRLLAGCQAGVLKIMITRGGGGRGYKPDRSMSPTRMVSLHSMPEYPPDHYRHGVKCRICDLRLGMNSRLAGIKHLNRLEQVLARMEWEDEYHEGIMLDQAGRVIEGTMSNIFAIKGNTLMTPLLNDCGVAGIIRGRVLARCQAYGLKPVRTEINTGMLLMADGLFLANSIIGIWPVAELAGRTWSPHPLVYRLLAAIGFADTRRRHQL